jgi:glutamyl-tRNA reductase
VIVVVGLSHKTAPIAVRERLALPRERVPEVLESLTHHSAASEAVVLSTCNRVEIYAACRSRQGLRAGDGTELHEVARAASQALVAIGGEGVARHLGSATGPSAVRHLFRVAASLDSLVVGEPQILGQLKGAIEIAREAKALGATLGKAMHRAVRVGKRVRTETAIGAGQVSVSSVAVDLARQIFGELEGRTAALVGAGEMAEAAARLLVKAGAKLVLVNRSPERAELLARDVGGEPRAWSELERTVVEADIVVSSTSSPSYVLPLELLKRVRRARKGRSLFLIDIAVPRDVDPAANDLENVYLYDVDDLSQIVSESLEGRQVEAARAEAIVADEARSFEVWALERALTPTIVGLRARTRAVLEAEVDRSLSGKLKHLGEGDRAALAKMIEAATNKLLHTPTARLRALAADPRGADYVEALRELFDLPELEDASADPSAGDRVSSSSEIDRESPVPLAPAALSLRVPRGGM